MANPNTAAFPDAVATDTDLLVASNRAQTTLASTINSSTLSITLTDASAFTFPGAITIENERIHVLSRSGNVLTVVTGGRGFDGSTAASHNSGTTVSGNLVAHHTNQIAAEIIAIETALGADLVVTATPTADAVPKADGSGLLDGWVSDASESVAGKAELATQGETDAGTDDATIVTPLKLATSSQWATKADASHATQHKHGGSDEVASATPGANVIPKADSGGKLADGWISESSVTQHEDALTITISQISDFEVPPAGDTAFTPAGNIEATNVQGAIEELDAEKAPLSHTHLAADLPDIDDLNGSLSAAAVVFTPAGDLAATDVQAAIEELDTEKSSTSHTHALGDLSDVDDDVTDGDEGDVLTLVSGEWVAAPSAAVSTPGGSDTELQFNNGGAFDGTPEITTDGTNLEIGSGAYVDIVERAAPSAPAAGSRRLFVDSATGKLSVQTEGDATVSLEAGGASADPGGDPGEVQLNIAGVLDGDPAFTWDNTNKTVSLANAVDGDHVALKLINSQANSLDSINETVQQRFGFAADEDVARIVVGKEGDHTTGALANSFMSLRVNVADAATERARIHTAGLDLTAGYLQIDEIAAPATPAANKARLFVDQTDGLIKAVKDSGAIVGIESASSSLMVTPEDYGAIGDGVTDDTAAWQDAIDDIKGTGGTIWARNRYVITASLTSDEGNFSIDGGGTMIASLASGSMNLFEFQGTFGSATGPAESFTESTMGITPKRTLNFDSVAGYAVGDLVRLYFSGTKIYAQISRIQNIASTTVRFADPIFIPQASADTNTILRITPLERIRIRNLHFDGTGTSGATAANAIYTRWTYLCCFENLSFNGFTKGAAMQLVNSYADRFSNIRMVQCGTASVSDFHMQESSNWSIDGLASLDASGFGPQWQYGANGDAANVNSCGANGRAIKLQGCVYSRFTNVAALQSIDTGLSITEGSYANKFTNVDAHQNQNAEGIWFAGTGNSYNVIHGARAFGNLTNGLILNSTDINNIVIGYQGQNLVDSGSNNYVMKHDGTGAHIVAANELLLSIALVTCANGANNDIATATGPFLHISGPSAGFNITSFANPKAGKMICLWNTTSQAMTLTHNSGGTAGNRINTNTGSDLVSTGQAMAILIYDSVSAIWNVLSWLA